MYPSKAVSGVRRGVTRGCGARPFLSEAGGFGRTGAIVFRHSFDPDTDPPTAIDRPGPSTFHGRARGESGPPKETASATISVERNHRARHHRVYPVDHEEFPR
jgi:hypothetical protein